MHRSVRILGVWLCLGVLAGVVGCNEQPLTNACTKDGDCGAGFVCNVSINQGICAKSCAAAAGPDGGSVYCRASVGNDADDDDMVHWACDSKSGQCFRSNACANDTGCGNGLLCQSLVVGVRGLSQCLYCEDGDQTCPPPTVCDGMSHRCTAGCAADPTSCMGGEVCQTNLPTAICSTRCDMGYDCSKNGTFKCDTASGLCISGCDSDTQCTAPKICHPIDTGKCFPPCPQTDCSFFGPPTYTCSADGHCISM